MIKNVTLRNMIIDLGFASVGSYDSQGVFVVFFFFLFFFFFFFFTLSPSQECNINILSRAHRNITELI